ncbi:hypothetical protein CROQUDRAFT_662202 [Cronartium quercuum f. sp. fusiforme G11]|uniref:Copper homeostasis protein cutC homolog n=1 Tax=Cronartium quercuum f. sp. fusiforme G11 TaxID=708437 RepID=A0A9P6NFF0_9BASI|nr:hypothetical protein CROQUDRAFT_662202 [Cronartium quercuum f. sp. fusiforme G11]
MARLIEAAGDLAITFHRAFDMVLDQAQAYEDILSLGGRITRILTSAGSKNFGEAGAMKKMKDLIIIQRQSLSKVTNSPRRHPRLMPGSGVTPDVLPELLDLLSPIWDEFNHRYGSDSNLGHGRDAEAVLGEIHLSGGCWYMPGPEESGYVALVARKKGMGFGLAATTDDEEETKNWGRWRVVGEKVGAVRSLVDR